MESLRVSGYRSNQKWYKRDEYLYIASRHRPTMVTLRCAEPGCRAEWRQNPNLEELAPAPLHEHEPSLWMQERNNMFATLRQRSSEESTDFQAIYLEEAIRYRLGAQHMPFESVRRSMQTWRLANQPPVPRSLDAFAEQLQVHPSYRSLFLDVVTVGQESAILLGASGYRRCLERADVIEADGTFQTVPASLPAAQILTVHVIIDGHHFHPIVSIMTCRTRQLYEAVFRQIWELCGGGIRANHYITDYEVALQGALRSVTGTAVTGCFFHFGQALVRRARELGMSVRWQCPEWRLVRVYTALALLPAEQIHLGLAEVRLIATDHGWPFNERFDEYFRSFWMARIGPAAFSVFGSPHRTTNSAESYHANLGRLLRAHPSVWQFMGKILVYIKSMLVM